MVNDRVACERPERYTGVPKAGAPAPDLVTIPVAARQLGLHPETLYRLARNGEFPPAVLVGASWRVSVPKLVRYLHGDVT